MSKTLPYFKFFANEWITGDITLEDFSTQGVFINVCAYYWSKSCDLEISTLLKKFKSTPNEIKNLIDAGLIIEMGDMCRIKFLDEQMIESVKRAETNAQNGAKGGRPKKQEESEEKPTGLFLETQTQSESKPNEKAKEEIREEKKKEDNILCISGIEMTREESFGLFWDLYANKKGKDKCEKLFSKLDNETICRVIDAVPIYIQSLPSWQQKKLPATWLAGKHWNDEYDTTPYQPVTSTYATPTTGKTYQQLMTEDEIKFAQMQKQAEL